MKEAALFSAIVSLCIALALCGCQTAKKGPSDQDLVAQVTQQCLDAAKTQDIDKLLSHYSDKFSHDQLGDKEGFRAFLKSAKDSGYLNGLEVDMSLAKTTIAGATASVTPVQLHGSFGNVTAGFHATKEDGVWRITGMDIDI